MSPTSDDDFDWKPASQLIQFRRRNIVILCVIGTADSFAVPNANRCWLSEASEASRAASHRGQPRFSLHSENWN
jgi:hypothetical protein